MANFSDYLERQIINYFFCSQAETQATLHYVALFTGSAGLEANLPTEEVATDVAYLRATATFKTAEGTTGTSENGATLTWAEATADWGAITHVAIVDHATKVDWGTGVNVLMWGALTATKTVASGDTFKIALGDLDITVA